MKPLRLPLHSLPPSSTAGKGGYHSPLPRKKYSELLAAVAVFMKFVHRPSSKEHKIKIQSENTNYITKGRRWKNAVLSSSCPPLPLSTLWVGGKGGPWWRGRKTKWPEGDRRKNMGCILSWEGRRGRRGRGSKAGRVCAHAQVRSKWHNIFIIDPTW